LNEKKTREALFSCLNSVLIVSQRKFKMEQKTDVSRLSWGRLMIQAISVYGKLLDNVELSNIQKDIDLIKEKLELGYVESKTDAKGIKIH